MSRGQFTGGRPETVYILEGLIKEAKGITTANGYFTNVSTALVPTKFFESPAEFTAVDCPALLFYPSGITKTRSGDTTGSRYRTMTVKVFGVVKQTTSVYDGLLALYQDLEMMMTGNLLRNRPDLQSVVSNSYGVFTGNQGVSFDLFPSGQSTVGYFVSTWAVEFKMWM